MKETKLLGTLMPSRPDLFPIVEQMRAKHNLPEIRPDDDPIPVGNQIPAGRHCPRPMRAGKGKVPKAVLGTLRQQQTSYPCEFRQNP